MARAAKQSFGARYATAELELEQAGMTALDRGFDGDDKQVWGSTSGPTASNESIQKSKTSSGISQEDI